MFVLFLVRNPLLRTVHAVQKPFVASATWIAGRFGATFTDCSVKTDLYARTLSERNQYAVNQAQIQSLIDQNRTLEQEIGFVRRRHLQSVPAEIVSRFVLEQTHAFVINIGKQDGVVLGSAVVVQDGMFVGKISRVDETQSVVTASTAQEMATGVTLLNQSRTIGIAEGAAGNLIEIKFIPEGEQIRVNDLVVTSGLEDEVPPGLVVGIVNTVKPDPEAPFQNAILEPLVDVRAFTHVLVLRPSL